MAGSTPALLSVDPALAPAAAAPIAARRVSPTQEAWRRFRRHRLAVASVAVLLLMVLAIGVGPLIWRVPINEIDFSAQLQTPSWAHPLGTDDLGQDVLARLLYGGGISLAGGGGGVVGGTPGGGAVGVAGGGGGGGGVAAPWGGVEPGRGVC